MNALLTYCRLSMAVSIGTTIVCVTVALLWGRSEPPAVAPDFDPTTQELESKLAELSRAWNPRTRRRLLDDARASEARLDVALLQVLWQPRHPRIAEAILLAGALEEPSLRKPVVALAFAGPKAVRPSAVRIADALHPFAGRDLMRLVRSPDDEIVVALLEAISVRDELPLLAIAPLAEHANEEIRAAASRALIAAAPRLLAIALDQDRPRQDRITALRCLESTRSVPAGVDAAAAAALDPAMSYRLARGLIASGRRAGVEILLRIAGTDAGDATEVQAESRQLLTKLSGVEGAAPWQRWLEQTDTLEPVELPPTRLD